MTDQELKDLVASLAIESKKTDEQIKELKEAQTKTDEELNKLLKSHKELGKMVGGISNNQGDVAEEYFINSLEKKLKLGTMEFDYLVSNYVIKSKSIKDEYDIVLINGNVVAIIEVKYKFHLNDLDKLPKKIKNFKKLPQYKGYKVYAGIAGFNIPDSVVKESLDRGYFVLKRSGDVIDTFGEELLVA